MRFPDLTPSQLLDFLLAIAPRRPVMIRGQPGIGKSALAERFAADIGMPCVSLLGSQFAPEDLIGVPQIRWRQPLLPTRSNRPQGALRPVPG